MAHLCWRDCLFHGSARYRILWFCSQGNKLLLSSFSEKVWKTRSEILIIENASCSNTICIRMVLDPWRIFTVCWRKYQQRDCGSLGNLKGYLTINTFLKWILMWFPRLEFSIYSLPFFLEDLRINFPPVQGVVAVRVTSAWREGFLAKNTETNPSSCRICLVKFNSPCVLHWENPSPKTLSQWTGWSSPVCCSRG